MTQITSLLSPFTQSLMKIAAEAKAPSPSVSAAPAARQSQPKPASRPPEGAAARSAVLHLLDISIEGRR